MSAYGCLTFYVALRKNQITKNDLSRVEPSPPAPLVTQSAGEALEEDGWMLQSLTFL